MICGIDGYGTAEYWPSPLESSIQICQLWNGESIELFNSPYEEHHSEYLLSLYNEKPTSLAKTSEEIKSFSEDGEWITVARLPYNLRDASAIDLDSGDLLILGFKVQPGDYEDDISGYNGIAAEVHKLRDGKITRIGELNEVR